MACYKDAVSATHRNPSAARATTPKAKDTRRRIVDAAMELFRDVGYEATTMRAVAASAGVSVGNAYYYFASKAHLLQAFYAEMYDALAAASAPELAGERDLGARLAALLHKKLDVIEPYHRFSRHLFAIAADPQSPLNPFHEDARPMRERECALFGQVIDGSRLKVPRDLAPHLPELLWTYSMGIVLYWIHDDSPGHERSRALATDTARLVARCLAVLSNPLMRPIRKSALAVLARFGPQA